MTPWVHCKPLSDDRYAEVRKAVIFDCGKWDPQVEDTNTIASIPIVLTGEAWGELRDTAEALSRETIAAEQELLERPDLQARLGTSRALRQALVQARPQARSDVRVMRFDFHYTTSGWRISEVNSDVPGGFNEATDMARLFAGLYPGTSCAGDPAGDLAHRIAEVAGVGASVALIHATAYTDDRQVMVYLARRLKEAGLKSFLAAPDQVEWHAGRPKLVSEWHTGYLDYLVRFFPAEWMPNLSRGTGWENFLSSSTPASNPGIAVLSQSKRLPLVWDSLRTRLPTWRRALPETRCPKSVNWAKDEQWVLKPAFGRVGDGVALHGHIEPKDWSRIAKDARSNPEHWVAQRRFDAVCAPDGLFPCLGVYTVGGRAAGIYGRAARRPLVDHRAMDIAVLVQDETMRAVA
jgi:glutathionylspermidine synthase